MYHKKHVTQIIIVTHINVCKHDSSNFDHLQCKSQRFSVKIDYFVIIIF